MYELWKERRFDISEHRPVDQARTIKNTSISQRKIREGTLQELGTTVDEEDNEELDQYIEEKVG